MVLEFGMYPSIYTLKSHIVPYMRGNAHEILTSLINCHVDYNSTLNAIVIHLLSKNKIRETFKLSK